MPFRFIRNITLILVAFFSFQSTYSQTTDGAASRQNYPVSASAFVTAQSNQKLAAYFSSNRALKVTLLLKDLTKPSLQVYLRWSIDGVGVHLASMDGYIPPTMINLDKGILQPLSGLDLQQNYFRGDLIEAQGLSGPVLRSSLPEGFYTFRVQALEAATGREVSNVAETYFSITTPQPPIINLPVSGSELLMTEPQRVNIQWMPRHYKLPGNTTTYDLKVCKVPEGYEPTEALDACVNPIIDDIANPGTFYPSNTGIGNSIIGAFEEGARYAARVTIHEFDTNGDEVIFANQGRSEVSWFTYGKPCVSPESFAIKETGPGRVFVSWEDQGSSKAYKVLYRKQGATDWTTQEVAGTSTTLTGLTQDTYEFAVQKSCSDVFPPNVQIFEFSENDIDDINPVLDDPLSTLISVSTSGIPYEIGSLSSVLDTLKIPCPDQLSTFQGCDAGLPVVNPVGTRPLTSLAVGDVLNIYDMVVVVTSVTDGNPFSGTGLVRLPFLDNTAMPVEFDGVQAWAPQDPTIRGGCVYEVNGYFRSRSISGQEATREQARLITTLSHPKDSTAFSGTLGDALKKYDDSATAADLSRYTTALLQGSKTIADALDEVVDQYSDPWLIDIKTRLDSLMQVLKTNDSLMKATGEVIKINDLTGVYTDLFKKLEKLKNENKPDPNNPVYAISNVAVSQIDDKSARISWSAQGPITRYVIEYHDTDGGVLQESVTATQLSLLRLRPEMQYTYRILAYNGTQLVASYGEDSFKTTGKFVPPPVNLAYKSGLDHVTITWDKNSLHKKFKLRYQGDNGEIGYVYPTQNNAKIDKLSPNVNYEYELVAYGDDELESTPARDAFVTGSRCLTEIRYSNKRIIEGMETELRSDHCYGTIGTNRDFVDGHVSWTIPGDDMFYFTQSTIKVKPTKTTTYRLTCDISGEQGNVSCYKEVTINVIKNCEGAATPTPLAIDMGDPMLLGVTGCQSDIKWTDGFPMGANIGEGNNILIYPLVEKTYTVLCKDKNGEECGLKTQKTIIKDRCDNFSITRSRYTTNQFNKDKGSVTYTATGCPIPVTWEYEKGNAKDYERDGTLISFYPVENNKKFDLVAKCGQCTKSVTVQVPYCKANSDFEVSILPDASGKNKIVMLKEANDFRWTDNNKNAHLRVIPVPTSVPVVYTVIPIKKKTFGGSVECDPIEIGINPVERLHGQSLLDCIKFSLIISPTTSFTRTRSDTYYFVPSGCTDGFQNGIVYWDNDQTDQRSIIVHDDVKKPITHKATCVIGDLKIEKQATLKEYIYKGDPINRPGGWGFPNDNDWSSGGDGNTNTNTGGTSPQGTPCTTLQVNYPTSVIKGNAFTISATCSAENSFLRIQDRQSPTGNGIGATTEGEGSLTINMPSSYFDYVGYNYDWTKPMEFWIACVSKTTKKDTCRNNLKIPVSCSLSVTFDATRKPIVQGCGGQSLVLKYFLNNQPTTLDKATHYKAECHTLASFSNIWCTKEGALPAASGRTSVEEGTTDVTADASQDCIHITRLSTEYLARQYLRRLLCEDLVGVYGTMHPNGNKRLSLDDARAVLEALKAIENSPQIQTLGFNFPVITEDMVHDLANDQCPSVVESLIRNISGYTDLSTSENYETIKAALDQSLANAIVQRKLTRKLYLTPGGQVFALTTNYDRRLCPTNLQVKDNDIKNGFTWGFVINEVEYIWNGTQYQDSKGTALTQMTMVPTALISETDQIQYLKYVERPDNPFPLVYGYNLSPSDFAAGNQPEASLTSVNDCIKRIPLIVNLFYEDFIADYGAYYNSANTRSLLYQIDDLVQSMMDKDTYNEFLKTSAARAAANNPNGKISDADLMRLLKTLQHHKQAMTELYGSSSPTLYRKMLTFFQDYFNIHTITPPPAVDCQIGTSIVPREWWDSDSPLNYLPVTLPMAAGFIDGAYDMVRSTLQLPQLLKSIYQIAACWSNPTMLWSDSDCVTTRAATISSLVFIKDLIDGDSEANQKVSAFRNSIASSLHVWGDQTFCMGSTQAQARCCDYHQGRLAFDIASFFFGPGEIKAGLQGFKLGTFVGQKLAVELPSLLSKVRLPASMLLKPVRDVGFAMVFSTMVSVSDNALVLTKGTGPDIAAVVARASGVATAEAAALAEALVAEDLSKAVAEATGAIESMPLKIVDEAGNEIIKDSHKIIFSQKTAAEDIILSQVNQESNALIPFAVLSLAGTLTRLPEKDTPGCEVCKNRSKAVCDEFVKVRARAAAGGMAVATAETAINKICAAVGTEATLLAMAAKLNSTDFTPATTSAFLSDVNASLGALALDGNLSSLSVGILDSWNKIDGALRPTDSKLRKDWETLSTIGRIITNESATLNHLFAIINSDTDTEIVNAKNGDFDLRLQTFIGRYAVADCQLCANTATYGIPTFKDVWANTKYMLDLYDAGLADAQKLLNASTFLSKVFSMKSGTNHMIGDMRGRNMSRAAIEGLDNTFTFGTKRYDLKRNATGGYIEYKSYSEDYGLNEVSGIGSGSWPDFDQFLAYLSQPEVTDLSGITLEYVFSAKKISDVGLIKTQFKKMMYDKDTDALTPQGMKVFDVIWENVGLKNNLWAPQLNLSKDQAGQQFLYWVSNADNRILNFIRVK